VPATSPECAVDEGVAVQSDNADYAKLNRVNVEMRKALIWRSGLALAVFVVIIGFGASTSPQPPWPFYLSSFGLFLVFSVAMSLWGDRKLAARSGRLDAPWSGSNASWTQTFGHIPIQSASHVAAQAVSNAGGRGVQLVNSWEAIGWIGSSWVNVPEWQEYQLDVLVSQGAGGTTCFTCSTRPRWKVVWGGASKSKRLAESLRVEVERLLRD
jgi:hypothetical protein